MASELSGPTIFDVNGTKYRVGTDPHGYIQIQTGEMRYDPDTGEDLFEPYSKDDDLPPHIMLDPDTATQVAEEIRRHAVR